MSLETEQIEGEDDSLTTGWFDIPYEMRSIVIDYMDFRTKFRFARCSELCYDEVQLSRNVLRSIHLQTLGRDSDIYHFEISGYPSDRCLFTASELSNKSIDIRGPYMDENLKSSTVPFRFPTQKKAQEFVVQTLRGLFKLSKNSLKQLSFQLRDFPYGQIKMENFRNLEEIHFLKNLEHHQIDPIRSGFININQLGCVSKFIRIPNLTTDEILKLKAEHIMVPNSDGDSVDIKELINRIFDGELDENVRLIYLQPEPRLDNIDGMFAKREGIWNYRLNTPGVDYLVKRLNKFILLEMDLDSYTIETNFSPDLDEWTIL